MEDKKKKISSIVVVVIAALALLSSEVGYYLVNGILMHLGYLLGAIDVILLLNMKKGIFRKIVLVEIIVLCILDFKKWDIILALLPDSPVYELTEEEKEWMHGLYGKREERIETGELFSYQADDVEMSREGKKYLEEKYPGCEFKIRYLDPMGNLHNFGVRETTSDYFFSMYIWENEDGTYRIEDNYYIYFFEDKFDFYIEKRIREKVERAVDVRTTISGVEGREYDINMTVDDVITGKLYKSPTVYIHITADGFTIEECMAYTEIVKEAIKEIGIRGIYHLYFWNMTEAEMISADKYEDCIYKPTILSYGEEVEVEEN